MNGAYERWLKASINYLEWLQARGIRYVRLDPEVLKSLQSVPVPPKAVPPNRHPAPQGTSAPPPQVSLSSSSSPDRTAAQPSVPAPPPPSPPAEKEAAMEALRREAMVCQKCPHLVADRTQVVFGVGNIHSPLLFLGEAPGMDEDRQGEPFVGRAGQLLTKIIQAMGLQREEVYIANILKCRPNTPGQAYGNRKPTMEEMQTCMPYILEQIRIIQPRVIVALGLTAVEGLFGKGIGMRETRGRFKEFQGIPVMPTYHPAYLLRNQHVAEKRKVWEDMLQVMERLEMPVSDQQRNFFLRKMR